MVDSASSLSRHRGAHTTVLQPSEKAAPAWQQASLLEKAPQPRWQMVWLVVWEHACSGYHWEAAQQLLVTVHPLSKAAPALQHASWLDHCARVHEGKWLPISVRVVEG